jgi:hypothetical protein
LIVFALGLFHGFGFANVLDPVWARGATLVPALAGFNVGVEIGQLLVIAVVFPVLFFLRNYRMYTNHFVPLGSAALILIAAVWFVQRTFLSGSAAV